MFKHITVPILNTTGAESIPAALDYTFTQPLLDRREYKVNVVSLALSNLFLPIQQLRDKALDPNNLDYIIEFRNPVSGINFSYPIEYVPTTNSTASNKEQYYYSFQQMADSLNQCFAQLTVGYNALDPGAITAAPKAYFSESRGLCVIVNIASFFNKIDINMTESVEQLFFQGFSGFFDVNNKLAGQTKFTMYVEEQILIGTTGNKVEEVNPFNPSSSGTGYMISRRQPIFNNIVKLFRITSSNLGIVPEMVLQGQQANTISQNVKSRPTSILLDLFLDPENIDSYSGNYLYVANYPNFYNITDGSQLSSLNIQVFWVDAYGVEHPLFIHIGGSVWLKLAFELIDK